MHTHNWLTVRTDNIILVKILFHLWLACIWSPNLYAYFFFLLFIYLLIFYQLQMLIYRQNGTFATIFRWQAVLLFYLLVHHQPNHQHSAWGISVIETSCQDPLTGRKTITLQEKGGGGGAQEQGIAQGNVIETESATDAQLQQWWSWLNSQHVFTAL